MGCLSDQATYMQIKKRAHDIVLPGKGWHWILGTLLVLFLLLTYAVMTASNSPSNPDAYQTPKADRSSISADKMQSAVRSMADFMVKDGNKIGLRMWAQSIGASAPDFASAATLRANISRASNDFALYRDKDEFTKLVSTLSNSDSLFIEVLNESMR